jgi:hypothetical protein
MFLKINRRPLDIKESMVKLFFVGKRNVYRKNKQEKNLQKQVLTLKKR